MYKHKKMQYICNISAVWRLFIKELWLLSYRKKNPNNEYALFLNILLIW